MRLGIEDMRINVAGEVVFLRHSLRAAYTLHSRHGGFDALLDKLGEGSVTAVADIVATGATHPTVSADILEHLDGHPLAHELATLVPACVAYVRSLAGADNDPKPQVGDDKPIGWEDYFTKLFEIGTGIIGWEPDVTWNATPAEILAAHKGRMHLLRAIFGTADDADEDDDGTPSAMKLPSEDERREGLLKLKMAGAR